MRRAIITVMVGIGITLAAAFTSFADWQQDNGVWRYQNEDGGYYTGQWFQDNNGKWYYFNQDGSMAANVWNGEYYLGSDGAMLVNTATPDGYQVDGNGKWIPESDYGHTGTYRYLGTESYGESYAATKEDKIDLKDLGNGALQATYYGDGSGNVWSDVPGVPMNFHINSIGDYECEYEFYWPVSLSFDGETLYVDESGADCRWVYIKE